MDGERSFREYQAARDAASALLGLGFLSLAFSLGYPIWVWTEGFGLLGWLAWGVGPISLTPAFIMIPIGLSFSRRAKRLRPE